MSTSSTTTAAAGKKVALFLGAGLSKHFGFLLTNQIFPAILDRLRAGTLFGPDPAANPSPDGGPDYDGGRGSGDAAKEQRNRDTLDRLLRKLMPGLGAAG